MSNIFTRIQKAVHRRFGTMCDQLEDGIRARRILTFWRILHAVDAENLPGDLVTNLEIAVPADPSVSLGITENDREFLKVCKYFRDGTYARSNVVVCEVPDAYCHVITGLVCTRDFQAINDSQMTYRMVVDRATVGNFLYRPFAWFKPLQVKRLTGLHATINNVFVRSWGHWIFDCLPRLYLLDKASAGRHVVLLVEDKIAQSWKDSLACVLPPNFEVRALPPDSWVQVDSMLLASYASGRSNSHMPWEFYDYVRKACFTKFGLSLENKMTERIYVSRAATRHRRIINEKALMELLSRYGFRSVELENLSFRQQVELFHGAEVVVTTDGSNCGDMMFAGKIKILILYSHSEPNTHWFTAAKGLGQEHYFLMASGSSPHADFTVDLEAMRRVLSEQMGLRPVASS